MNESDAADRPAEAGDATRGAAEPEQQPFPWPEYSLARFYSWVPRSPPWPGQLSDWVVAEPNPAWVYEGSRPDGTDFRDVIPLPAPFYLDPLHIGSADEGIVKLALDIHLRYEQLYWSWKYGIPWIHQFLVRDGALAGRRVFTWGGTPWSLGLVRDPDELAPPAGIPIGRSSAAGTARVRLTAPGSCWRATYDYRTAHEQVTIVEAGEELRLTRAKTWRESDGLLFRVLRGPHAGTTVNEEANWSGGRAGSWDTRDLLDLFEPLDAERGG